MCPLDKVRSMFVCPFSPYDLVGTGVWIAVFHLLHFDGMYECAVYLFLCQLFWLIMDVPRAWMKTVETGLRDD